MQKGIIFDWGRTLFDSDTKREFPEAEEILRLCRQKGYKVAVVSLVSVHANANLAERKSQIEKSPLRRFFEFIAVTDTDKDAILEDTVAKMGLAFGLARNEIMIVDDRVIRGIKYGNLRGHKTVWLKKGKFADELPNDDTGKPDFIIKNIQELAVII